MTEQLELMSLGPASCDDVVVVLTVPGNPASKARPRVVTHGRKTSAYTPSDKDEEAFAWQVRIAHKKPPVAVVQFGVLVVFYMKDLRRKDVDNMVKLVLDACNKIVWDDDQQVCEVGTKVVRGVSSPRTELLIYRVRVPDAA